MANEEESLFRILIASDNHLGVWERDELRKNDSFDTFEEVLQIAIHQNVDLLLLGGDLFHDNKPSRTTIIKAVKLLTDYCMNDRAVSFEVLSDQRESFASGGVNFENPNINVGLPVFTIHGNHDDPSGEPNLSAVDVLSSCGLVNYFGRSAFTGSGVGKVRLTPILLRKGETQVALYGLGNAREERLVRCFMTPGQVDWVRPSAQPDFPQSAWYNIFALHQNRMAHAGSNKDFMKESLLPRFLDFVVWGHEHECISDPWESGSADTSFHVVQPGSSVATALSEGESKPKHVLVLEILKEAWRTVKHPLHTVRPFFFRSISLADQLQLDPDNPDTVTKFLEQYVEEVLRQAATQLQDHPDRPKLPLVRVRVDYSGFTTINTQRFGQTFVGKVANPHDMILWHKAPARRQKAAAEEEMELEFNAQAQRPEAEDQAAIEALIAKNLTEGLQLLPEDDLASALHDFVEKDEKLALANAVKQALNTARDAAQDGTLPAPQASKAPRVPRSTADRDLLPAPSSRAGSAGPSSRAGSEEASGSPAPGSDSHLGNGTTGSTAKGKGRGRGTTAAAAKKGGRQTTLTLGRGRGSPKGRGQAGRGRTAKKRKTTLDSDEDEDSEAAENDAVEEDSEQDNDASVRRPQLPVTRTAARQPPPRPAARENPPAGPAGSQANAIDLDSDDDDEPSMSRASKGPTQGGTQGASQQSRLPMGGRRLPASLSQPGASQSKARIVRR